MSLCYLPSYIAIGAIVYIALAVLLCKCIEYGMGDDGQ